MKRFYRLLMICTMLLLLFSVPIHAEPIDGVPPNGTAQSEETKKDPSKEATGTADFISDALKSLDKETAKKESSKNYIRNFYNSSNTATTKGFFLFDGDAICMFFLNMITTLIEMIGIAFTFVIMLIYNLVSSSFLTNVIQSAFDIIDKIIFDWKDPNSWIMKILLIATLMSILYQLIKNFTRMTNWKHIMQLVITSFATMTFIIFIGQNGRTIAGGVEKTVNTMLSQSFVFGDEKNPEIANKDNIFDILQVQPFMVRHYGTTSYVSIAGSDNKEKVEQAKERVQNLLDDPSEDNAKKEHNDFGNNIITHNTSSAAQVLFLSIIMLVHRIGIGIVLGVLCLGLGVIKAAKTIILALSVYQLIWWLIKRTGKARQWFMDRIIWCAVTIIADVLFNASLYFIVSMCTDVGKTNILLMLAIDAVLIFLIILVAKNFTVITSKLKDDGKILAEAMMSGNPMDAYREFAASNDNTSENNKFNGSDDNESESSQFSDNGGYDDSLQDSGDESYASDDEGLADDYHESQDLNDILDDTGGELQETDTNSNDTEKVNNDKDEKPVSESSTDNETTEKASETSEMNEKESLPGNEEGLLEETETALQSESDGETQIDEELIPEMNESDADQGIESDSDIDEKITDDESVDPDSEEDLSDDADTINDNEVDLMDDVETDEPEDTDEENLIEEIAVPDEAALDIEVDKEDQLVQSDDSIQDDKTSADGYVAPLQESEIDDPVRDKNDHENEISDDEQNDRECQNKAIDETIENPVVEETVPEDIWDEDH